MKKPDYGDATPEDLARALMSERLKAIRYQQSVRDKAGSSQPAAEQPPSSEPGCQDPELPHQKSIRNGYVASLKNLFEIAWP